MSASDFAKIAEALAWPTFALFTLVVFHFPLARLLESLTASLKIKTIKLKVFGVEAELTPQEVKAAVDELLQEISDPTNELKDEELDLFERIASAEGRLTVADLEPLFSREQGNVSHARLRRLRDRHVIRPAEGSRWQKEKHPVLTRFGRLIHDLRPRTKAN